MSNLIFSMNATLPIFLVMMLGYFFRKKDIIGEAFASRMNTFVFRIALPVSLFGQLDSVDFFKVWDTEYVLFCFLATLVSVGIGILVSFVFRDREVRGEFVQGSYRSSASLLGMAYIENIYGKATMGPLMMLGCVPMYNVMAVLVLSLMGGGSKGLDRKQLRHALKGIVTNPIIWGIVLGFAWALTGLKMPVMFQTTIEYIGRLASPMGLLAMGASLNFGSIRGRLAPILTGSLLKLIGFAALFLPVAIWLGFRTEKLIAALIMLGSASTVAGYVMAKNMGHDGVVSSGIVMITTLCSVFTLTFWIWLLRSMGFV
ncbi:MAG: AEC family transporter [Eubacterium sp.]|nr:AEC family transporter [Eubacterium sp.]